MLNGVEQSLIAIKQSYNKVEFNRAVEGDRGAGDREKRGREVYGRREKRGQEAGGKKGKITQRCAIFCNRKNAKRPEPTKYRAGSGIKA